MAVGSLHEMIKNLTTFVRSLEVLCESGVTLAKNFERLLSPGPGACSSSATVKDSDMLTQSVATWELAQKVATTDCNGLISELFPLLQETVDCVMKDPASFNSPNTDEVFRSCFSAFFQIQWRFCQLYISCASSAHGSFLRSPDSHLARSPTLGSLGSSSDHRSDRRESTESCMSAFSIPTRSRQGSSFSGVSSLSSRSSSPGPSGLHLHPRSRNSSIFECDESRTSVSSVKLSPSQPPSPLNPFGESYEPYLFRRWSHHTNTFNNVPGASSSGLSSSRGHSSITCTTYPSAGGYGSVSSVGGSAGGISSSSSGMGLSPYQSSRRWSVPAPAGQNAGSTSGSGRRTNSDIDNGLMDAINLLSAKSLTPSRDLLRDIPLEESREYDIPDEDDENQQTASIWPRELLPPSETIPGVVLTSCGSDPDIVTSPLDNLQLSLCNQSSLRVPYSAPPSSQSSPLSQPAGTGEYYTLFGSPSNNPSRN